MVNTAPFGGGVDVAMVPTHAYPDPGITADSSRAGLNSEIPLPGQGIHAEVGGDIADDPDALSFDVLMALDIELFGLEKRLQDVRQRLRRSSALPWAEADFEARMLQHYVAAHRQAVVILMASSCDDD
jgi:hypothetical protein